MKRSTSSVAVTLRPDKAQGVLSLAIHGTAAVCIVVFGTPVSELAPVLAVLILVPAVPRWLALLQWPAETAVSRITVTRTGLWFLTDPMGFVHSARILRWRRTGATTFELTFRDNEWRKRRAFVTENNSSEDERLRLALHLKYLVTLPGLDNRAPYRLPA